MTSRPPMATTWASTMCTSMEQPQLFLNPRRSCYWVLLACSALLCCGAVKKNLDCIGIRYGFDREGVDHRYRPDRELDSVRLIRRYAGGLRQHVDLFDYVDGTVERGT